MSCAARVVSTNDLAAHHGGLAPVRSAPFAVFVTEVFMKTKYILFLSTILNYSFLFGQGPLTLTTDKASYQYGETIEVHLKIANNTDSLFTIVGSSTCVVGVHPPDIQVDRICTDDEIPFPFPVGSSRTWIWRLIPSVLGYPIKNGTQTIYGFGGGNEDSVLFTAPKYYGGMLSVSISLTCLREKFKAFGIVLELPFNQRHTEIPEHHLGKLENCRPLNRQHSYR